jgi:hypothetical protein
MIFENWNSSVAWMRSGRESPWAASRLLTRDAGGERQAD